VKYGPVTGWAIFLIGRKLMQAAVEMMVMVTMWKCFRCWRRTTWTRWTCWHTSDLTVRRPVMLAAMMLIYCRCFHSCPTTLSCWDLRQNRRRCPTWTSRRCFRCGRSNSRTVAVDAEKNGVFSRHVQRYGTRTSTASSSIQSPSTLPNLLQLMENCSNCR